MKFTNVSGDTREIGYVSVEPGDDWEPTPEEVPGLLHQVGGGVWEAGDDEAKAAVAEIAPDPDPAPAPRKAPAKSTPRKAAAK